MKGSVVIDCFPESAEKYKNKYAIVVIDIIRATTTVATALSLGRRVFPVRTTDDAFVIAAKLKEPLLVGELGGNIPYGFEITNSPAHIAVRTDVNRPMVFISSSGTQLMMNAEGSEAVYISCFRNLTALTDYIAKRHEHIAVIGAGTRGEFRQEDQMGCAWVAERLVKAGFKAENSDTEKYISCWSGAGPEEIKKSRSAEYLLRTDQAHDLEFVINHIDDLNIVPSLVKGEVIEVK